MVAKAILLLLLLLGSIAERSGHFVLHNGLTSVMVDSSRRWVRFWSVVIIAIIIVIIIIITGLVSSV